MSGGYGAFGKMPSVGDFFRINTPPGFVRVWDAWIQNAMLAAQTRLGEAWDDHYMSAPIWRFSLSPGLAGAQKILGVTMPSVDRVGRRFPLTLMTASETTTPALLEHFDSDTVFSSLEDLALDALEDSMTKDGLESRLSDMPPLPNGNGTTVRARNGSLVVMRKDAERPLLPGLATALLQSRNTSPSVWSCLIDAGPRMLICNGLPEGHDMHGLFDLGAPVWNEATA